MIYHQNATATAPARVIVLGASGFVGGDLMAYLREQRIPAVGFSSRELDLLQHRSVEQLHRAVHCDDVLVFASTVTPDKDARTLMQNLAIGEHVATFLEHSACSQVIYISSDAVYDDAANPVREETPCNPASLHGVMHLARERILAHAAQKSGTPFLAVRSTLLYGPNDPHNGYGPNQFVRTALMDRIIKLFGDGEDARDHLYIRDLSRLIGLCIKHHGAGIVDAATGHSASFHEVADTIIACGADARLERLPRLRPVWHRHFDIAATLRAFPMMRFTPLHVGLMAMTTTLAAKSAAPQTQLLAA